MTTNFIFRSTHHPVFSPNRIPIFFPLKRAIELRVPSKRRNGVVARMKIEDSEDIERKEDEKDMKLSSNLNLGTQMNDEIDDVGDLFGLLGRLPVRYKLIATTSIAFVICNMDKVNLSIAIIPMSHQFGWNSSTAGLVQSSFFWGYALSQLPGGWLAKIFGGSNVLKIGVLAWSLATMLVPFTAGFMPGLVLSRILVGIGEGVSPSAATDLIARTIPVQERSRAVAVVFGGLSVGSVLGLLLAPPIIQMFGWESVFYIFGVVGIVWCVVFELVKEGKSTLDIGRIFDSRQRSSDIISPVATAQSQIKSWDDSVRELVDSLKDVPLKAFFKSPAVWAMIYAHFCGSWGHYTCLSWLPTYFRFCHAIVLIFLFFLSEL